MKNILIIRVSAIGDVIHTFPAVILLKTMHPSARIHWVVQKKASSLLHHQTFVDNIIQLPDNYFSLKNISATLTTIKELRKTKWDAIIDYQGLSKTTALHLFLSGKKFGFDASNARSGWTSWFTHQTVKPEWKNIIQKNLALASGVAQEIWQSKNNPSVKELLNHHPLIIPQTNQEQVAQWLTKNNIDLFIALAPNTTWLSKHWPTQHWQTLVATITNTMPTHHLVLLGESFGAQAKELAAWTRHNFPQVLIAPGWDLLTTAQLLKQASLFFAPDTGLLHLADFLGTKIIALFGPTLAVKHGPFLHDDNRRYAQQASCSHFYKKIHTNQKTIDDLANCMYTLAPRQVVGAMVNYLKE